MLGEQIWNDVLAGLNSAGSLKIGFTTGAVGFPNWDTPATTIGTLSISPVCGEIASAIFTVTTCEHLQLAAVLASSKTVVRHSCHLPPSNFECGTGGLYHLTISPASVSELTF